MPAHHSWGSASPACLRPLSQLQCTNEALFHTPIPSATWLASLWRQLDIEMREFDDPGARHHQAQLHLSPETITRDIQALHQYPKVTAARISVRASALFYAADQPAHRARIRSLSCRHAGGLP